MTTKRQRQALPQKRYSLRCKMILAHVYFLCQRHTRLFISKLIHLDCASINKRGAELLDRFK